MMRFAPRFLGSGLGLVAALSVSASAYAVAPPDLQRPSGECLEDADCGHGFDCQSSITSAIGGGFGGNGNAGGGSDPAGAGGTGTAGTGSGGVPGAGNASSAPLPTQQCGNQLCELPENPTTCRTDCVEYRYCALAECDTASDCAEGYRCEGTGSVGTGGGPSAPVCGDGVCNGGPESEATCPEDCASRSFCTPESGYCLSDGDCVAGFYCSFYGSGSGSGGAGVGGSPGTGGSTNSGGSAGASTGGTAGMAEGGDAEAPLPEPQFDPNQGDRAVEGTCMPGGAGSGGTSGVGGDGGGGISSGGTTVGTGGTGAVSGSGGSSEGGEPGGTGSGGDPGTGARTSGGSGSSGTTSTTAGSAGGGGSEPNDDVVVTRGCSVSEGTSSSGFGSLAFAALALAGLRRRRARGEHDVS
jgi:MYXO-CTERM domain-containing protein